MSLDRTNIAIKPREKKNAREIYLEPIPQDQYES